MEKRKSNEALGSASLKFASTKQAKKDWRQCMEENLAALGTEKGWDCITNQLTSPRVLIDGYVL